MNVCSENVYLFFLQNSGLFLHLMFSKSVKIEKDFFVEKRENKTNTPFLTIVKCLYEVFHREFIAVFRENKSVYKKDFVV